MSMNQVASSNRIHIGFFGRRNAGKSSLVNAVTGQNLSVVSEVLGTTTDPVRKTMELLPLGPVVVIDTPGFDDEGELGQLRIKKTQSILDETDYGVIVVDCMAGLCEYENNLIAEFQKRNLPYVVAYNKYDLLEDAFDLKTNEIFVSAKSGFQIKELKELIAKTAKKEDDTNYLVSDLLTSGDMVVLVIPIDESAPKGRLIMPQQMVMRDILDAHCSGISCQPEELEEVLQNIVTKPRLVITDSQVFQRVSQIVPENIPLTSFSILMARFKGDLEALVEGADVLEHLQDGDKVLIAESCTHHRQCNDIGTVKLPNWIRKFSGAKVDFSFTSGMEFPEDLSGYNLIVHCGGCMINETAMKNRMRHAKECGIPIVNYGVAIAKMNGILARSIKVFL